MAATAKLRLALCFVGTISILCRFCTAYTPADNYLISCGSSVNTRVGPRVFVADADDSGSVILTAPKSAAVKASPDTAASGSDEAVPALYQTARVFTAPSSYSFRIRRRGRHFVRLRFFPFACQGYDLAAASFKVSTQDVVLMDGFAPDNKTTTNNNGTTSPVRRDREFLLSVTRDTLVVKFVPLVAGGLAFVNAVEVVSALDDLIALPVQTSSGQLRDPAVMPLQTAYRVNVGGPAVSADGDTLTREWTTDDRCLVGSAVTREEAYNGSLN